MRIIGPLTAPGLAILALLPNLAAAQVPAVVTDIAPVHSLVALVMGDLGAPGLLVPPDASPHDFALRPSDVGRLSEADLVILAGAALTPWLDETLASVAGEASRLDLLATGGWDPLPLRELGPDERGHEGDGPDPHAWLDPSIAATWLAEIAHALGGADPENGEIYRQNAETAAGDLAALDAELAALMGPLAGRPFILPHDGYQYFEARYGLSQVGIASTSDGVLPGPAHIAELQELVRSSHAACVLSDLETGPALADLIREGTTARTAVIDGIGIGLEAGPGLYPQMLRRLGAAVSDCLS